MFDELFGWYQSVNAPPNLGRRDKNWLYFSELHYGRNAGGAHRERSFGPTGGWCRVNRITRVKDEAQETLPSREQPAGWPSVPSSGAVRPGNYFL